MDQSDYIVQQVLQKLLANAQGSAHPGGIAMRHTIGAPSYSPDPAFLFAPHGSDSVRVYWNEAIPPLAAWLGAVGDDKEEETYEFLSYFVPNQDPPAPGVQDNNKPCSNCGDPSCTGTNDICTDFGKTAQLGPVYRYNVNMGRIVASSATVDWTRAKARQNRGAQRPITFRSWLNGQTMTLSNQREIFAYLANHQWMKVFSWSLWGGKGFNGSFPGVLETVRPGWAKENEYRISGYAIPDNAALDPAVIDLTSVPYYDQPWLFAERVQQVITEMTMRGQPPVVGTANGVSNVLMDFALVASPEWFTHFAKLVAKTGMLNDYSLMPNAFSVSINPRDTDMRFMAITQQGPGWWGYIPTPYGNVPFVPEFYCDPHKIPADGCQRSADECDTSDTYATTMRLLVRRSSAEDILGLRYLDFNKTAAPPPSMQAGTDFVIGDSGRWITTYPTSQTSLCDRAVQYGYLGMFNAAPTLQTVFTGATYRGMLEPHRYTPGSNWFLGGPDLSVVQTATRSLVDANPQKVTGTISAITGGNGVWTITAAALDSLTVVPVGSTLRVGSYVGHVMSYSDATNSITVLGDLTGVTVNSAFTLGVTAGCTDCPDAAGLVVLGDDDCNPTRATFVGVVDVSTGGMVIDVNGTAIEGLSAQDLLGGYVTIAGAMVGRIAKHAAPSSPGDPAVITLAVPTNVPIADGDTVVIHLDSGCESSDPNVERLLAFVTLADNVPLGNSDDLVISFVSTTGATTSVTLESGYPQPGSYLAANSGASSDMIKAYIGQNVSTGGATVWVDLRFKSTQVSGVYVTVRVPFSKA